MNYDRRYKIKTVKSTHWCFSGYKNSDLVSLTILKNIGFLSSAFDIKCHGSHICISFLSSKCNVKWDFVEKACFPHSSNTYFHVCESDIRRNKTIPVKMNHSWICKILTVFCQIICHNISFDYFHCEKKDILIMHHKMPAK